jgi:hypothetical protein
MAHKPVSQGPAKGRGNGSPRHPNWTHEEAKEMSRKGLEARRRMAEIRKSDPTRIGGRQERKRQLEEYMIEHVGPDAISAAHEIVLNPNHEDHAAMVRFASEQVLGRARQAVELTGEDGKAIEVIRRVIIDEDAGDKNP